MLKKLNRCDIFLILFVLYYLQGILYTEGGVLSLAIICIILIVSAKSAFDILRRNDNPSFFKGFNALIGLFTIYGIWVIITSPSMIYYPLSGKTLPNYGYLKGIYLSLLPIYTFYKFTKEGYIDEERLKIWIYVFLISCTFSYFKTQQEMQMLKKTDEITNNAGYIFLSMIPSMFLLKDNFIKHTICIIYIMIFIIMGMKRGAILIGGIALIYYIYLYFKNANKNEKKNLIITLVVVGIIITMVVDYLLNNSDYFIKRINDTAEGKTSRRDDLYGFFYNYFINDASFIEYLFGRGARGTLEIYYNFAHNDWLEIAVNNGILGIIIYAYYWISFGKTIQQSINTRAKNILTLIALIYFLKTIFSMSYGDMTFVVTCVFGFSLANIFEPNSSEQK